uniref:Retrotransposon gag domain-containing protein n=1 Tax=Fagus sylvatica TaxID=28930 RepID=A0A2N9F6D8_FAGSY
MAPGSRGVGAVFVHFSGVDSGQTGNAIGEPRVPRRSRSHYLSNEFHVVAGVIIFPTHPGSRINLLRAGKTLRAKAAVREKKCVLLPARFFSNLVPVPDSRESELGLVRYGPASRVHRGVFGPFEGSFPIGIPAGPDKFLAIREFHVVHGMCPSFQCARARRSTCCESGRLCAQARQRRWENSGTFSKTLFCRPVFTRVVDVAPDVGFVDDLGIVDVGFRRSWYRRKACVTYFLTELLTIRKLRVVAEVSLLPKGLGSRTKLQRVRENLCANAASQIGCFVNNTYQNLAKGGQFDSSFWSGQWSGQTLVKLGQPWSNLVELGQSSPNSWRMYPGLHFKGFWARWVLVGLGTAVKPRSNFGQTSVKPRSNLVNSSQTWSTLVKLGQTLGNVSRTFFLGVFEVMSPRRNRPTWFGLSSFCVPTPEKIPGVKMRVMTGPQPKDYNKDLTCEYHQGEVGHTVENCRVLRHRIQDLLDQGVLKFRIEGIINTIGIEKSDEVDIASTKIPWEPFCHETKKQRLLTTPRAREESTEVGVCGYHSGIQNHNLRSHEEIKKEIANLMMGGLQEWRRIKGDFEEFCEKKKEELGKLTLATPPEMSKPDPVVIQYATKEKVMLQTASVSTVQSSEKVPSVVIQVPQPFPYHDNKRVPWNYGMKVISTWEGKPKMEEEVVGNLTSGLGGITRSGRCYTPEELEKRRKEIGKTVEDPAKTKVAEDEAAGFLKDNQEYCLRRGEATSKLCISPSRPMTASCRGCLIDNGSALNVCPLSTLEKLDIDPTRVRVTSMVVRAFDGTRREVLGEIDLPVEVGPQVYNINFQVLRIDSPYNLLLGRPWLHTAGAVPSSLHQKMKLIIGSQLVTILAEEPISIYNDGEIPYIDGCASEEASFHSFEFVTVIHRVAAVEPRLSRAGIMVAREFVKAGFQPGARFRLCEPRKNRDCNLGGETKTDMDLGIPRLERTRRRHSMEDNGEEADLPDLLPHLMISRGLETLEFEMFCEHEDPESHLQRYRKKMALYTDDEILMISMFHESLPECAVTWFYQLRNIACWEDLARAFLDRYRHNLKTPPPSNITTTTAEEEYAGPMVEGLSIHTITEEEDSTTPPTRHCQQGEEAKMWTCVPLLQRVSSSNE